MRVVLATTAPGTGGVTRHMFDLAHGLRQLGNEVTLAGRSDARAVKAAAAEHGLVWRSLADSVRIGADVWHIHLHNTLDSRATPLVLARRTASRGAVIMTEHLPRIARTDPSLDARLPADTPRGVRKPGAPTAKKLMKAAQFRFAHAVIAVSNASAEFISRRWGAPPRLLATIHNGVQAPKECPALEVTSSMRVVGVAELHWLKGFDVLLEAAARAREHWSICIVGDGPDRERLELQAAAIRPPRRVEFTGWRADAGRASLNGDVLCAPSRAESFSYVILEAMACGRPVVASAVDGAREAITDGQHGFLVAPHDASGLAEALDRLARDPALRAKMGRAAYERLRREFTTETMVDRTVALYEEAGRLASARR
jgi:glycosyltransferase involved in cell wall biosynthesis